MEKLSLVSYSICQSSQASPSALHLGIPIPIILVRALDPQNVIAPKSPKFSLLLRNLHPLRPSLCTATSSAPQKAKRNADIPYQHLSQNTCHLLINPLLRARQLDVHITVNANETAFVFCLTPFETDDDFFIDPIHLVSAYSLPTQLSA